MKKAKKNYPIWGVMAICMLALGGMFLVKKDFEPKETKKTETQIEENKPLVEEEVKDGVYTNYTYGFKFEYPEEIFNVINPWSENSGKEFFVEGQRFPQLKVSLYNEDFYGGFYGECFGSKDGELFSKSEEYNSASKKRYNLDDMCVSLVIPYYNKHPEVPWNHTLVIPNKNMGGKFVSIYLSGENLTSTLELQTKFDNIVKSFRFLEK